MQELKTIIDRTVRTCSVWLYSSMAVAIAVVVFYYASSYRFYLEATASQYLFYGATVLAVLVIAMMMLTVRNRPRRLRQIDDLGERLTQYAAMLRSLYSTAFVTTLILCAVILLRHDNTLLMFVILMVLMLFLSFPNMYKVKADVGLTHAQMAVIYGEAYTRYEETTTVEPLQPAEDDAEQQDENENDE